MGSTGKEKHTVWGCGIAWKRLWLTIPRSLRAPTPSVATLCPVGRSILCASHIAFLLDPDSEKSPAPFTASSHAIHTLLASDSDFSSPSSFLTSSESETAINVYDVASGRWIGNLLPGAELTSLALFSPTTHDVQNQSPSHSSIKKTFAEQILAAVTKEGILELFPSPFEFDEPSNKNDTDSKKARRKRLTKKATAAIKIVRPEKSSASVPLLNVSFEGNDIVMAWTERGVNLIFDRIRWRDEATGRLVLQGLNELVKAKIGAGINGTVMNGVKDTGKSHTDESHTVVTNGGDVPMGADPSSAIDISSGEEESEYSEEDDGAEAEDSKRTKAESTSPVNHETDADITMKDVEAEEAVLGKDERGPQDDQEAGGLSFGEMIRAHAIEAIDVQTPFPPQNPEALTATEGRNLHLPSSTSLGTVLTQALRTNDVNLLESCLHQRDLRTVRATIERIESSLAGALLEKLAERLYSRPGRAGNLMVWVQWTLVSHGGYLAGQPELMKKLVTLHRVVGERANSLQPLLSLKGKLDMLEAQVNLRKSMRARSRAANSPDGDEEDDVIYIEGQEESESEGEFENAVHAKQIAAEGLEDTADAESGDEVDGSAEEEDDEGEMPTTTNGVQQESEDEGSESDENGLIDDEAESTDGESDVEISADEVDYEDGESEDAETPSEPEDAPPAKRLNKTKLANGIGKRS